VSKPTYDQLDGLYRSALREIVQLRRRVERRERVLLRMKGKNLGISNEIGVEVERMAREDEMDAIGLDLQRFERLGAGR
jgi:hypothetical protein